MYSNKYVFFFIRNTCFIKHFCQKLFRIVITPTQLCLNINFFVFIIFIAIYCVKNEEVCCQLVYEYIVEIKQQNSYDKLEHFNIFTITYV
jgi:hypothetical protein